jgi:hypothetical protein
VYLRSQKEPVSWFTQRFFVILKIKGSGFERYVAEPAQAPLMRRVSDSASRPTVNPSGLAPQSSGKRRDQGAGARRSKNNAGFFSK